MNFSRSYLIKGLFVLMALLLAATAGLAQSQASTGQIAGTVKDAAGAVIVGASVKATSTTTGFTRTVNTGQDGYYLLVLLPPGKYTVAVNQQSFGQANAEVEVGVGRTTDLNVNLSPATQKVEVTVTAEMIELQRHEAAAYVGATVVSNLPLNGRRFQDIVNTTPTAQTDPSRGGISMTGQRMVNTGSINIDGADYGQLFFGGIRGGERAQFAPTIPLDSIQEFQITRAGYSAEFGRSTGGTIAAVTKSGTNDIHGSVQYVVRPSAAGASTEYYNTIKSQLVTKGCSSCVVNPNPTLHQWGGSVGGPIKKDKLFFFGSYEQQRQRIPHQVFFDKLATYNPASVAGTQEAYNYYKTLETPFEQTNDAYLFLIKADYQINEKNRLSVRYNHSNYEGKNANSVGTNLAPTVNSALSNNGTELDTTRTVVGSLSTFFTHFANELRGQYAHETRPRVANALMPTVGNTVGYFGTVSYLGQNKEWDYRAQFADNVTWMKGTHTIKFGGEFNRVFADQTFGFNQFGAFSWSTSNVDAVLRSLTLGSAVSGDPANRFDDTSISYNHQIGNLLATLGGEQFGLFIQDSWRLRPNFTLNYGLRWDGSINPSPTANNAMVAQVKGFAFPGGISQDPTKIPNQVKQFAPRLGFAWDPQGNGKTVIRGFGGMYYAATPMLLYAASVNNFRNPPGDLSVKLPFYVPTGVTVPNCPGACNTVYQQLLLAGINLNSYTLDKLPNPTTDQINSIASQILAAQNLTFNPYAGAGPIFTANNFSNPRSYQSGFGVEHEFAKGWTAAVEGTWIKTVHLERDTDLNMPFSPCTDAAGRPVYRFSGYAPAGNNCPSNLLTNRQLLARPISTLGSVVIRDASAKSLYRALTFRTTFKRNWGQVNAYYTLAENLDDDYQERSAGGVQYQDRWNWKPDYGYSDLNRRHQFVAQPVFFLPWQFELSSALRMLSGSPINATVGSDLNQDGTNNDRPYWDNGVSFKRNSFTKRAVTYVDLRVQKSFKLSESQQIKLSAEMFNLFNLMNLTYSGSAVTNYCSSTSAVTCGMPAFAGAATNGWTPNANFLKLRDANGALLTNNNSSAPFQAQFSFKFIF